MGKKEAAFHITPKAEPTWLRYILLALLFEKTIQHVVVTAAFYFNWAAIRSTVAVHPGILLVLGGIVALLFGVSLWGLIRRTPGVIDLVIALAVFDIVGEVVAQGKIGITITLSFLVAIILLVLAFFYRHRERQH